MKLLFFEDMKYYQIDYRGFTDRDDYKKRKSIGNANGEFVPNGRLYFDRMGKGEIIEDAPVLDYFHLQNYDKRQYWERCLQDVHGFIGVGSIITGWYFSDKCKQVFEQFNIAKGFHFYPTKLLYKGTKLDYWIFQYVANDNGMNHELYIDYAKSEFLDADKNAFIKATSYEEFKTIRDKIRQESDYEKDLITKKIVLNQAVDFIPLSGIASGRIVSDRLKQAIEEANLIGFEFSELGYEIVVEEEIL